MAIACEPGDVVMHHCAMVHMAGRNTTSARQRRALGFIYYHEDCRVDQKAKDYQAKIRAEWKEKGVL